jgi:ribosome biogenesis GTPase / thiamine phosphate phosphatase
MTLTRYGWTVARGNAFAAHAASGFVAGRVTGEHRTHFEVMTEQGEVRGEVTGRLRNETVARSDLPGVGDWVGLRPSGGDGPASIEVVLPRTSALIRKASSEERPQLVAANVDVVFVVTGLDGDFNLARIERFLTLVRESGARPVIVANKVDLVADASAMLAQIAELAPGVALHGMSASEGAGVAELTGYFEGNTTVVLIGSSGVGKSTLTNALIGREAQATGDVREHDSRGRHTTTHRQLFLRPLGGAMIDTPGMRGLETWQAMAPPVDTFDDVAELALSCKFRDCAHGREPGCAVQAAVKRGELTGERVAASMAVAGKTGRGRR